MPRWISLLAIGIAMALASAGCSEELGRSQENVAGSWQAPFADVVVTLNFFPDGSYTIDTTTEGTQGEQLFNSGAWMRIPAEGQWQLEEDQITFSDSDGATTGGLEIVSLTSEQILLRAADGNAMFFSKVDARSAGKSASGNGKSGKTDEPDVDPNADAGLVGD